MSLVTENVTSGEPRECSVGKLEGCCWFEVVVVVGRLTPSPHPQSIVVMVVESSFFTHEFAVASVALFAIERHKIIISWFTVRIVDTIIRYTLLHAR